MKAKIVLFFAVLLITGSQVQAAICVLRNPDRDVFVLFPEATNYKAFYADLDNSNRKIIEGKLGQPLDINDVGTHTFYVILKNAVPVGFIHARAEWGKYGNVEVIWAFNLDGTIKDYMIQRSREMGTKEIKKEEFRSQFSGKKRDDPFIIPYTKKINVDFIKPVKGFQKISSLIAYSANKTFILNYTIFKEIILDMQSLSKKSK